LRITTIALHPPAHLILADGRNMRCITRVLLILSEGRNVRCTARYF
jgi:hypothetical protein